MTEEEINEFIAMIGKEINLLGYTSTSLDQNVAKSFTWENTTSGHSKVFFHIKWKKPGDHYFLNSGAYDSEKEVLLYDGVKVWVHSVETIIDKDDNKQIINIVLGTDKDRIKLESDWTCESCNYENAADQSDCEECNFPNPNLWKCETQKECSE